MLNQLSLKNTIITPIFLLLFFTLFILNGCSSVSRKDGPPSFPVDETKIPNAVPKKEPLSKYGNLNSYRVFGKRYYTMRSSKHYEEQGTASWYGTKFHRVRTSSGERYDMLGMTAAHKTLPLPTYVQVTNLANNKRVIVKVNDRGPFEGNRLIDLSYVAAKKLGMIGHGTAHVDVKAIDPDEYNNNFYSNTSYANNQSTPYYNQPVYQSSRRHGVYLQVGAFQQRKNAEHLKNRLRNMVSSPVNVTRIAHNKHGLYHVQIGPIRDASAAHSISKRLKSIGLSSTAKNKTEA